MRVLIPDAGEPPPSFIRNLVKGLEALDMAVDTTGPANHSRLVRRAMARLPRVPQRRLADAMQRADVVHFQWPPSYLAYGPMARGLGKPTVLSLRGRLTNIVPFLPGQEQYRDALRHELPLCNAVHCVSQDALDRAVRLGLDPARAVVIRPAIDVSVFRPHATSHSPVVRIAMIGALMWRKGYEYALAALAELARRGIDFHLSIVGDGPERERVEWAIRDLGLDQCVTLLGSLEHEMVADVLSRSDLLLHTSLSEGISNGVLEAMACALPVVVWDSGGMSEAITHRTDGVLVPPWALDETADALEELARDRELGLQIGRCARRRVEDSFNFDDRPAQFGSLYQASLKDLNGPPC